MPCPVLLYLLLGCLFFVWLMVFFGPDLCFLSWGAEGWCQNNEDIYQSHEIRECFPSNLGRSTESHSLCKSMHKRNIYKISFGSFPGKKICTFQIPLPHINWFTWQENGVYYHNFTDPFSVSYWLVWQHHDKSSLFGRKVSFLGHSTDPLQEVHGMGKLLSNACDCLFIFITN